MNISLINSASCQEKINFLYSPSLGEIFNVYSVANVGL